MYRNVGWIVSFILVLLATMFLIALASSLVTSDTPEHSEEEEKEPGHEQQKDKEPAENDEEQSNEGRIKQGSLMFSLAVTKGSYKLKEEIPIKLVVVNEGARAQRLSFADAQRFDAWVETAQSAGGSPLQVWRWSRDVVFAQVLGEEILSPGKKLTYKTVWDQRWQIEPAENAARAPHYPGRYVVYGIIGSEGRVVAGPAKVAFVIRE